MALTQELDDECEEIGSKIVLTSNIIEEEGSANISSTSTNKSFKLKKIRLNKKYLIIFYF